MLLSIAVITDYTLLLTILQNAFSLKILPDYIILLESPKYIFLEKPPNALSLPPAISQGQHPYTPSNIASATRFVKKIEPTTHDKLI